MGSLEGGLTSTLGDEKVFLNMKPKKGKKAIEEDRTGEKK